MPSFSVAVISRNESLTLPRLVASLAGFRRAGGAILVLDTGSDDGTADVARQLGCAVEHAGERFTTRLSEVDASRIERHFSVDGEGPIVSEGQRLFNFAEARQCAGELATHDVVLQLDGSDEVLALDLPRMDAHLSAGGAGAFSYRVGLGGSWFDAARFYDRRWYHWQGRTHEALYPKPGFPAAGIPPTRYCGATELLVTHHRQQKERNYLAGLALDALACPETPRWKHYLGRELYYGGWYRSAMVVLEEHALMMNAPRAERSQSLAFAGECLERLGQFDQAESAYLRAIEIDGARREPLLRLGELRSRRGDFAGAAECGERALAIRGRSRVAESDANYTWLPHAILYWSLLWLGRMEDARRHWDLYRTLGPRGPGVHEHARFFPDNREPRGAAIRS